MRLSVCLSLWAVACSPQVMSSGYVEGPPGPTTPTPTPGTDAGLTPGPMMGNDAGVGAGADSGIAPQPGLPSLMHDMPGAVHVSVGYVHSCVRLSSGQAWCWGGDRTGQLGDGLPAEDPTLATEQFGSGQIQEISAGSVHTCSLTADGKIQCVGSNWNGQVGNGTTDDQTLLGPIAMEQASRVSAGGAHTCAINPSQQVYCWGGNEGLQLGTDSVITNAMMPVIVPGVTNATQISSGFLFSCAKTDSNEVWCWGSNCSGQVGAGAITSCDMFSSDRRLATKVGGLSDIIQVNTGDSHACALTRTGSIYCWGRNHEGQLGNGSTANSPSPVLVSGITNAIEVAAGENHTCAIDQNGQVWCWGANNKGQLGDGSMVDRPQPVLVSGVSGAVSIDAYNHTCAATASGEVFCWGNNNKGQLGNGAMSDDATPTPARVLGLPTSH